MNLPLTGTTSWTSTSDQAGFRLGDLTATIARKAGGFLRTVQVSVFVDGAQEGNLVVDESGESFTEVASKMPPRAFAVEGPGTHTITVKFWGGSDCKAGSKIDGLHVALVPLSA